MTTITTKAQAKTIVSALRREFKALNKGPQELSHTDCLGLMAKALGFTSWNAWEATLKDAPAAPKAAATPGYPLVNTGQFDFVSPGVDGKPYTGMLSELNGTYERVYGVCPVISMQRSEGSTGKNDPIEYGGGTTMFWDDQVTLTDKQGFMRWLDSDGDEHCGAQVVLVPEDYHGDVEEGEELPVRDALLAAYLQYLDDRELDGRALQGDYSGIADVLGFALTEREAEELATRFR